MFFCIAFSGFSPLEAFVRKACFNRWTAIGIFLMIEYDLVGPTTSKCIIKWIDNDCFEEIN